MKLHLTLSAATACAVLLTVGCKKKEVAEPNLPPANLEVVAVQATTLADTLTLPAHISAVPTQTVHVFPPLSGRIVELKVVAGQEVHKGQTIAMLQSGDVAAARADFAKAAAEVDRADRARDRGKLLLDHEVMSQGAFLELQAASTSAHAEMDRTRQRLRELGFSESNTSDIAPIAAPISGTVLDVGTSQGEMQRSLETSSGIATIANLDTVWVEGDVFERDLSLLRRAEQVSITVPAYPGETFHGAVANVGDVFDPATHTLRVRVVLANPGHRLKPAMFANLNIQRPASTAIVVPASAILHNGESAAVYVQGADGKFTLRPVQTGSTRGEMVVVQSGLGNGDRIVKTGAAFLRAPAVD